MNITTSDNVNQLLYEYQDYVEQLMKTILNANANIEEKLKKM